MKLRPLKTKFEKSHKGKFFNTINSDNLYLNQVRLGTIALKVIKGCKLTAKQIENLYFILNKFLKRAGKLFIKIFPSIPVSKKPNEFRMGKGKGAVDHWSCTILPGTIICEIETNNVNKSIKAINYIKYRLPVNIKIIQF